MEIVIQDHVVKLETGVTVDQFRREFQGLPTRGTEVWHHAGLLEGNRSRLLGRIVSRLPQAPDWANLAFSDQIEARFPGPRPPGQYVERAGADYVRWCDAHEKLVRQASIVL